MQILSASPRRARRGERVDDLRDVLLRALELAVLRGRCAAPQALRASASTAAMSSGAAHAVQSVAGARLDRSMAALEALNEAVVDCRRCPRLVEWREQVAREKRAAYRDWDYWGRPMQGFGDPAARVLILGLAPAAHGGNRTGRIFTGDRSGDFLFAVAAPGRARQPGGVDRARRRAALDGAYIVAAVRCAPPANLPTPRGARELLRVARARGRAAAGRPRRASAWAASRGRARCGCGPRSAARRCRARSRSSATARSPTASRGRCSAAFTPSQQNTFTGKLTPAMMDAVLRAGARAGLGREALRARSCARRYVGALVASSLLARLPIGINALAIVLYLREQTGLVRDRRRGVGHARGRLGGRRARSRAGSSTGSARAACCSRSRCVHAVALGAIVALRRARRADRRADRVRLHRRVRDPADLVRAALACGPTCSSRACTRPAYALDSTMIELIFISGPLLTAAIAAVDARPRAR